MVRDECLQVAPGVRDEPELEALGPQLRQHGQRVLVELEVLGVLPGLRHRDGAIVSRVGVAAHAADDPLCECDPDLLVVLELGVALDALDGPLARRRVARRVELQPEALTESLVPLRPELRPGPGDREVDVEEDGLDHQRASSSQRAVSTWVWWSSPSEAQATVCAIVHPRARSGSRPSSAVSRSKRRRTSRFEWPSSRERTTGAMPSPLSTARGLRAHRSPGARCAERALLACP